MRNFAVALLVLVFFWPLTMEPARAVEPDEILSDPKLEARARKISLGLRCLKCQNQSIDDSNAGLAKDLRVLVRERLVLGETNDEITDYIADRYGDYVLMMPRFGLQTLILWLGPVALLLFVSFMFYQNRHRSTTLANAPESDALSKEEQKRLDELMNDEPTTKD